MNQQEKVTPIEEAKAKRGRPSLPKKMTTVAFPADLVVDYKKGKYESSLENVVAALRCHDVTGVQLAYDSFFAEEGVFINGEWMPLSDNLITEMRLRLAGMDFAKVSKDNARDAMFYVCENSKFDSAQRWLTAQEWDGKPRVEKFFSRYFKCKGDEEYIAAVSRYTWTALAGRVMQPGIKADMVPLLYGAQGARKSTGVRLISPFSESYASFNLNDKDDVLARKMRGCIVGELEELRGLHGRDAESTKAFFSSPHDEWVPKFKEFKVRSPRRVVFIGTTNNSQILNDSTGNRRYLPMSCGLVDCEAIEKNRSLLWAEALHMFKENGIMWQQAEELARKVHDDFRVIDPWEDALADYLELDNDHAKPMECATTETLFSRLGIDIGRVSAVQHNRLSAIMARFGYEKGQRRINGKQTRGYFWRDKNSPL